MPAQSEKALDLSVAHTFEERCGAFSLIQRCYTQSGLSQGTERPYRVTKYQLLERSRIFITKYDGSVVATVSLIPDTPEHGLPMDMIYRDELNTLRDQGKRIAEVGCLADRRRDPRRFIANFCELTRLMAQHAVKEGLDGFTIMVHPRHAKFYQKLCFKEIGGLTSYPVVGDLPAVALYLDFEVARVEVPKRHSLFFDTPVPPESISNGQLPTEEIEYFRQFVIDAGVPEPATC